MDNTNWTSISVEVDTVNIDEASAIAHMAVPYGIYIEDYSDLDEMVWEIAHIDLIDEDLLNKDKTKAAIHLYIPEEQNPAEAITFLTELYTQANIPFVIGSENMKEEDWAFGWKKYYHPLPIGERLIICPSWETCDPNENQKVLTLDPGMAFGTGTHNTTKLVLERLQKEVKEGDAILDLGTGSGILAIAALLLGAKSADLCDIDPTAVAVAKENAVLNGVDEYCTYLVGDLEVNEGKQFDLIFANIVADVILRLIPRVKGYLAPGGKFLASGIVDIRKDEVLACMEQYGLEIESIDEEGGWVALTAK